MLPYSVRPQSATVLQTTVGKMCERFCVAPRHKNTGPQTSLEERHSFFLVYILLMCSFKQKMGGLFVEKSFDIRLCDSLMEGGEQINTEQNAVLYMLNHNLFLSHNNEKEDGLHMT